MATAYYHFLIHHRLLERLRLAEPSLRDLVQKTLERLQCGEWKNGTRVKRLRGVSTPVLEARIDRARRLLFTITRTRASQPPYRVESYALIWDVVEHDAVSRRATRLNTEPEAGFLDFAVVEDVELTDVPVNAAVSLAPDEVLSAAVERFTEPADTRSVEMTDPIKWFELDADYLIDESSWQELMDAGRAEELELKLTCEQAEVVSLPGPVLLRGAAGSGKTTVSVYRAVAVAESWPGARILYVTYNDGLLKVARRQFADLCSVRRLNQPAQPDFLTFPELYHRLAGRAYSEQIYVRFSRFRAWYQALYGVDDAALAWEEIRGIIKGACVAPGSVHLTRDQYKVLGRKRAPAFRNERDRLYRVFERYQKWCDGHRRIDDVDLARIARTAREESWDFVICDEGQDLTELEMALLLDLCARPDGLFFAADPQQIVNPSGFRWAEIRMLMRQRSYATKAPEVVGLSRNFRSVSSIVMTANAIVQVQRERTGRSDDDHFQESTLQGAAPLVVGGDAELALNHLRGFGPRCAIIVADDATGDWVRKALGTERVFPISEAKGLEFDGCVLWDLMSGELALWEELMTGKANLREDSAARRALKHLYVAVTRSRRFLGMYESAPRALQLWQCDHFRGIVEQDVPDALSKFMLTVESPDRWLEEGDWFFERGRYRQAAECYRLAGEPSKEISARASDYRSVGDYLSAADLFASISDWMAAGECQECLEDFGAAAAYFGRVEAFCREAVCRERIKQWALAAEAWRRGGDVEAELRCLVKAAVKARSWERAANLAITAGDEEQAIIYYRRAGLRQSAENLQIEVLIGQGEFVALAKIYEQKELWGEAAEYWALAELAADAARCRALSAEGVREFEAAEGYWLAAGEPGRAAAARAMAAEEAEAYFDAASYWHSVGKASERDRVLGMADGGPACVWLAAIHAENAGDVIAAIVGYEEIGQFVEAEKLATWFFVASSRAISSRYGISADQYGELLIRIGLLEAFWRCQLQANDQGSDSWLEAKCYLTVNAVEPASLRLLAVIATQAEDDIEAAAYLNAAGDGFDHLGVDVGATEKRSFAQRAKLAAEDREWLVAARYSAAAGHKRQPYSYRAKYFAGRGQFELAAEQWTLAGFSRKAEACRERVALSATGPQ